MDGRRDGEGFAQRFFLIFQIGDVLEVVGVDVAVSQQLVGVYAAGEFDDFQVEAGIDLFYIVKNFGVRHRVGGDAQRGGLSGSPGQRERQCNPCQFKCGIFHHLIPCVCCYV